MRTFTATAAVLLLLLAACGAEDPGEEAAPEATPAPTGTPTGTATGPEQGEEDRPASPTQTPSPERQDGTEDADVGVTAEAWVTLERGPRGLTEIAAAGMGGRIFTAGGLNPAARGIDTVLAYDPAFDHWDEGPPLPVEVHHTAMVSTGAELLQVGGYVGQGFVEPSAAVHRLDPATGEWEEYAPLPEPRGAGAAAWDGARVVYAGGMGPDGLAGDVYALDLGEGTWARVGELAQPREHLAAASDGQGRVWFLGGRLGGLTSNQSTVEMVTGDQVEVVGELPTPRGGVAGFYHPSAGACAVGGEDPDRTYDEVECVDAGGQVTILPPLGTPRHGLGVVVVDDVVYAMYGGHQPGLTFSAVVEALRLD